MASKFPYADVEIVQFAKEPILGNVKTRMQPALSQKESLVLHKSLLQDCCNTIYQAQLCRQSLWVGSSPTHRFFTDLIASRDIKIEQQQGSDLGARMFNAAETVLVQKKAVIIVGSDCPFFTNTYLEQAICELASGRDVVIGPASDGGYVLIGLSMIDALLFSKIEWGTDQVLSQTRERIQSLGITSSELPILDDIDRPEDLDKIPFEWRM